MNPTQAAQAVAEIAAAWPNPAMTDLVTEAWLDTLAPLDFAETRNAIRTLIATSAYRPTPADVAKLAGSNSAAERAFAQYLAAVSAPRCPALDPAVRHVMDHMGGWFYCHAQPMDWHHRTFPARWRDQFGTADPLTQPMAELPPATVDRVEPTGTPDERREFAAAQVQAIRSGWRSRPNGPDGGALPCPGGAA